MQNENTTLNRLQCDPDDNVFKTLNRVSGIAFIDKRINIDHRLDELLKRLGSGKLLLSSLSRAVKISMPMILENHTVDADSMSCQAIFA